MEAAAQQLYCFGPFVLDPAEKVLLRDGHPLSLPPKAIDTLVALLERHGHVVNKTELLLRVWPDAYVEEATLAQNVSTLRRILNGSSDASPYIETVPKRGYRFIAPVEIVQPTQEPRQSSAPLTAEVFPRISRALLWSLAAVVVLAFGIGIYYRGRGDSGVETPGEMVTLAVLPFENFTGDAAQDYLTEGFTEEMIAQLSRINPDRLRVIARTTAMQFKGTHKSVAQIGRELGANYVLESSFRREGNRARITTQLVRTKDQTHLWSQVYQRDVREILPLETEVAQAIAREIAVKLSPQEQARLTTHRFIEPEATYTLYLQGRYFWNKRSEQGHLKAIEYFNQAIAADPAYAQAYSGLADAYALLGSSPTTAITRRDAMERARAASLKAIAINDTLAEAHTSLAFVYWHYDWNWADAEKEFRRALQLNPSYPTAHHWFAYYLASQGRIEQALGEIRRAQETDPLSLIINTDVAEMLYYARQYDQSIQQAKRVLEMDPGFVLARVILVWSYLAKQQYGAALEQSNEAVRISAGKSNVEAILAITYAGMGRTAKARDLLFQMKAKSERLHTEELWTGIAQVYAALGEKDQAFAWLEKDVQNREGGLTLINVMPFIDSLRGDSRFADLVRRIGLPFNALGLVDLAASFQ